jgi:inosine-uridine nucleoside N-ribohydrolase
MVRISYNSFMSKIPVIYDGDMGGDDLWAITMLLAHRDRFNILGITTCFGNVGVKTATRNVLGLLQWLGVEDTPVVQGAFRPYDGVQPPSDDAYGTDGIGGVILPESLQKAEKLDCPTWIGTLLDANPGTRIFCTGPATNLAQFLVKYPEKAANIGEIIFMGGALSPPGADFKPVSLSNGRIRKGNITEYAEFNAFCDPEALNILLKSNVKLTILSADATQYMVLSAKRQEQIKALDPLYGPALHSMLMAALPLDQGKFGVDGPFIHDPNVISYALRPDLYRGVTMPTLHFLERTTEDPRRGEAKEVGGQNATAPQWINHVRDTDAVFEIMRESLETVIKGHSIKSAL